MASQNPHLFFYSIRELLNLNQTFKMLPVEYSGTTIQIKRLVGSISLYVLDNCICTSASVNWVVLIPIPHISSEMPDKHLFAKPSTQYKPTFYFYIPWRFLLFSEDRKMEHWFKLATCSIFCDVSTVSE